MDGVTYSDLISKRFRIRLIIGIILNVGQQLSAINTYTFYSNSIYSKNEPDINPYIYSL